MVSSILNLSKEYPVAEAIPLIKDVSKKVDHKDSINIIFKLNVDPKQGDQNIRGTCVLPAGRGEEVKVCVFTDRELEKEVLEAGADFFGTEELVKKLANGEIPFDKLIATSE